MVESLSKSMKKLKIGSFVQLENCETYLENKRSIVIRKVEEFFENLEI